LTLRFAKAGEKMFGVANAGASISFIGGQLLG